MERRSLSLVSTCVAFPAWPVRPRCISALMGALVLLGLAGIPVQAAPFAYITNSGDNTVSVLDTATNTVVTIVPVGSSPVGVAVHPAETFVYVANRGDNTVSILNTTTNTVMATVSVASSPVGVAVHPAGTFVYVANASSNTVSVLDTATNTVVATVPVGTLPEGVAVHPAGTFVYVANQFPGTVSVLNTATNTVVAIVPVGSNPVGVAVHPAGALVYVVNEGSNSVSVLNTATNTVMATVSVGHTPRAFGQFISPALPTVVLTLTGCTTCQAGDTLSVTATIKNLATKPVSVEIKAGVVLPDGTEVNAWAVVDKHFTVQLPAGLGTTVEILHAQLPSSLPKGSWGYEAVLIDPELGRTLARDAKSFSVQ